MKRSILFLCFFALLVLSGCHQYRDIAIRNVKVDKFNMKSTSQAVVQLNVSLYNPSSGSVKLKDFQGVVYRGETPFALVSLASPVIFPVNAEDHHTTTAPATLNINLQNLLAVFSSGIDLNNPDFSDFYLNGHAKVKIGVLSKRYAFDHTPLEEFVKNFSFN